MKLIGSGTTTSPREQPSKIGMQGGGHGLATQGNLRHHATPEEAAELIACWPDLLHSPIQSREEFKAIKDGIGKVSTPAPKKWVTGRVMATLLQYFNLGISEEMHNMIAADWYHELQGYPAWALSNAFREWTSENNPLRRQKPLPGDIAAMARKHMGAVKVAEKACRDFERATTEQAKPAPEPQETPDLEARRKAAAEIMAKFRSG